MKKSTLALSFIAVLGAVVTAGSWYTGNQVAQKIQEILPLANQKLKVLEQYGIQAEMQNPQFSKGLFRSELKYDLKIGSLEDPSQSVILNGSENIYHGPLPLNRLQKLNFMPVLLSSEGKHISKDSRLASIGGDKEVMSSQVDVSYGGEMEVQAQLIPFNALGVETSGIRLNGNQKGIMIKTDFFKFADQIQFTQLEAQFKPDIDPKYPAIQLGEGMAKMKAVRFNDENATVVLENLEIDGKAEINQGRAKVKTVLALQPRFEGANQHDNIGKASFDLEVNLEAERLNRLFQISRNPLIAAQTPEGSQILEEMLANSPKAKGNLVMENDLGKNTLLFDIQSGQLEANRTRYDLTEFIKLLNGSKIALEVNSASLIKVFKPIMEVGLEVAQAEELASNTINALIAQGKAMQLLKVEGNNAKLTLDIENQQVTLNGNRLSEQALYGFLFMLMLGGVAK